MDRFVESRLKLSSAPRLYPFPFYHFYLFLFLLESKVDVGLNLPGSASKKKEIRNSASETALDCDDRELIELEGAADSFPPLCSFPSFLPSFLPPSLLLLFFPFPFFPSFFPSFRPLPSSPSSFFLLPSSFFLLSFPLLSFPLLLPFPSFPSFPSSFLLLPPGCALHFVPLCFPSAPFL